MDFVTSQKIDETLWEVGGCNPALPPDAPLDMSEQSLWISPATVGAIPTSPKLVGLRRAFVIGGTVLLTAMAAYQMYLVLTVNGPTVLQAIVLVLYVALFAWIAFSFITMVIGFFVYAFGRSPMLFASIEERTANITTRCALLIPTYNEAPHRLFARVQATFESVETTKRMAHFDFFVLSDTTNPEIWIAEERAYLRLRSEILDRGRVFYRHRINNEGRKAGNIAEWIRRFGKSYDSMIVLDADSLMTGDTMVRLVAAIERYPRVGLIQTLPTIVNADTLFARLQQFAGRVYGPLVAYGIGWWHGSEGNYWGHNAIIRVRAFAESAGLPMLRGPKPFGGPIMSHDFVEAALMRRRGWAIHLAPGLGGSYEEAPPSLDAYTVRDRRWCQGNLQHVGVLMTKGLHWMSRLHLLTGIGSYITAPLWLCFILVGVLISLQAHFIRPEYFAPGFSLFPRWPTEDPYRAALVFSGTMAILLIPKLLGLIAYMISPSGRAYSTGLPTSLLSEVIISGLIAPAMMWKQTVAVFQILLGRDSGWNAQQREGSAVPFKDTLRRYSGATGLGLLLGFAAFAVSEPLFWWMSPVILGLMLTVPLAITTSSPAIGRAARRWGLLAIPEERAPPLIITRAEELTMLATQSAAAQTETWQELLKDTELSNMHRVMLPQARPLPRGQVNVELLVGLAKLHQCANIHDALKILSRNEKRALLGDRSAFDKLKILQKEESAE